MYVLKKNGVQLSTHTTLEEASEGLWAEARAMADTKPPEDGHLTIENAQGQQEMAVTVTKPVVVTPGS